MHQIPSGLSQGADPLSIQHPKVVLHDLDDTKFQNPVYRYNLFGKSLRGYHQDHLIYPGGNGTMPVVQSRVDVLVSKLFGGAVHGYLDLEQPNYESAERHCICLLCSLCLVLVV